jgi:hypothetical protein
MLPGGMMRCGRGLGFAGASFDHPSRNAQAPPPVLQPRTLAQPYTPTLCLFPYTACSWQLSVRPLLFPGLCAVVCADPPSSTSTRNYRQITLHAIKSTPGMAHSLHTALQPHLVSASPFQTRSQRPAVAFTQENRHDDSTLQSRPGVSCYSQRTPDS